VKKCKNCGKDISDYAVVCPNCGCAVNAPGNGGKPISSKSKLSRKIYIVIAVVAAVLLIPSGFVFACAQNAYNCVIGKSPIGLGAILFEEDILNFDLSTVMVVKTGCISIIVICVLAIATSLFLFWRSKRNHA